ncbi:MAG: AAA family ATPase [Firmicutes bacterium]|nr:AAA family ATPase [Bacillota bacterium]
MLRRLYIEGFKSLRQVEVEFPRLTVLFGPNAAGKSNIIDAVQALSRLGTSRTLSDAFSDPIRGYSIEVFSFPSGGVQALLEQKEASFKLEADLTVGQAAFRYRVVVAIKPESGSLYISDEYLTALDQRGQPRGNPRIEAKEGKLLIRRASKGSPREEALGLNYTQLSDPRLSGTSYHQIERCRQELVDWRVYYLDPRVAMRSAKPPAEVRDIGILGEDIAPFLYRLRAESPKDYEAIKRTLRSIVPSIEELEVDLDKRRGTLDILIRQNGTDYSSRIVSEGTLRLLAVSAIAVNPWGGSLIAFEEPENGVHPRRLELIAQLLIFLAKDKNRQVIVTTHSPVFCDAVLKGASGIANEVAFLNVYQNENGTAVHTLDSSKLTDEEFIRGLTAEAEDGIFQSLMVRGMLDG